MKTRSLAVQLVWPVRRTRNFHFFEPFEIFFVNDDRHSSFQCWDGCVSLCYQWWSGPSRLTHTNPHTLTAWHTHWEVILPRHASGNQCHITSWAANPATLEQKQIFPAVWFLDCSSLFSHYAPLCVVERGEGGSEQTLDLSSGVISSLAKRRPAKTCPMYQTDVSRCVAVIYEWAALAFV